MPSTELREIDIKMLRHDDNIGMLVKSCLEMDPEKRPSAERMLNLEMFEEFRVKDYALKNNKSFSPSKPMKKPSIMSISPMNPGMNTNRKISPLSNRPDHYLALKKNPNFFHFQFKEKLPMIRFKQFISPKGIDLSDVTKKFSEARTGTKSTLKSKIVNRDFIENPSLSLVNNYSNENIIRNNVQGSNVFKQDNKLRGQIISVRAVKKRYSNIKNLDFSGTKNNSSINTVLYNTSRK
jgi:hypothetical protein